MKERVALWTAVAQYATLLGAFTATLLIPPPLLYDLQENQFAGYASKAIAIALFMFIFVFARRFNTKAKLNCLASVALALFVCAFASIFVYSMTEREWSCRFPGEEGHVFIRGEQYTTEAKQIMVENRLGDDCGQVMLAFSEGSIGEVWNKAEMKWRYYNLLAWFLVNSAAMIAALMLAIEGVQRTIYKLKE